MKLFFSRKPRENDLGTNGVFQKNKAKTDRFFCQAFLFEKAKRENDLGTNGVSQKNKAETDRFFCQAFLFEKAEGERFGDEWRFPKEQS